MAPESVRCGLPGLAESDLNPDLPSQWDDWELAWPDSCVQLFRKMMGGAQTQLSLEPLKQEEDGCYVVRLFSDQADIRRALVANLRDPKLASIKEPVTENAPPIVRDTSLEEVVTGEDAVGSTPERQDRDGVWPGSASEVKNDDLPVTPTNRAEVMF